MNAHEKMLNDTKQAAEEIERTVRALIAFFIHHPESLEVQMTPFYGLVRGRIRAHARDTSLIIGEGAHQFRSLTKIAGAVASRKNVRVSFGHVEQPVVGIAAEEHSRIELKKEWPKEKILELLLEVAKRIFRQPECVRVETRSLSETETMIEVWVSEREVLEHVKSMSGALAVIFDAIGKFHSHLISLVVVPSVPSNEGQQPKSADGRHAREVQR